MAYTCACNAVRDETVIGAIGGGACTLDEVAAATRAGTDCGGCVPTIEALLALSCADDGAHPLPAHLTPAAADRLEASAHRSDAAGRSA